MGLQEERRWGLLLDILSEISDVERQVVTQTTDPAYFLPESLLDRWDSTFRGGQGLREVGLSDHLLASLIEFDLQVEELIDIIPGDTADRESYLRHDNVWRAVREMADYTLLRVVSLSKPQDEAFNPN